ncbi:MAG: UDP-N-acetylglucosamine 1-carboxyvinyltransferase [Actinobacteria bacterium]|nr:UDP-N-acetylglucosamine 1-carboxyvinyltransferase [Actinomycetota bacterium]MCG2789352.1 UDP-N-acetylglucosamine 1-carboxyvinyltransferase [Actinomycetes bacterium]
MKKYIIRGNKTLSGNVRISGAKNSALKLMAASILANSKVTLQNVPDIEDVNTMAEVLKTLNAKVVFKPQKNRLEIDPSSINSFEAPYELVRKMRASVLVAGPLLSKFGRVKIAIPGGCNIGARQIDLHLKGFENLGAENYVEHGYINCAVKSDKAKVINSGSKLKGSIINLDFPSRGATENLMMAACMAEGKTVINNAARETETVDLANFLISMGAQIDRAGTDCIEINGVKTLKGTEYRIMPDSIEAGTFIIAASLCGSKVVIENAIWKNIEIFCLKLKEVGIDIESRGDNTIVVRRLANTLNTVYISTLPYPGFPTDLQPIIAVLLSVIPGISIITENVFENRFMYVDELNRMGANIKIDGHHAVIKGVKNLSGAPVKAFDLRAGAAMVLAGLAADGITEVSDIHHIQRGYENFESKLAGLGADISLVT